MDLELKLVVAGLICRNKRYLITKRKEGTHLQGCWEFPGGKLEKGESPRECLAREIYEELGVKADVGEIFDVVYYPYEEFNLLMLIYRVVSINGEPFAKDAADIKWIPPERLNPEEFPPADRLVIEKLRHTP